MITAVDTNILLDVLRADPDFGEPSRRALKLCRSEGSLIACEVVWAELAAGTPSPDALRQLLDAISVEFRPLDVEASLEAGRAWRAHRKSGGGHRPRVTPDFLVGAHARHAADRLLTRDRGFYARCFRGLTILDPSTA